MVALRVAPLLQDKAQQTMLTTWLIELFLNELGSLSDSGEMRSRERLQKEFYNFLSQEHLKVKRGWDKGSGLHSYGLKL